MTTVFCFYNISLHKNSMRDAFCYFETQNEKLGYELGSIGISNRSKLFQFKSGKQKLQNTNFEGINDLSLLSGVAKPGSNENWQTYFSILESDCFKCLFFCLPEELQENDQNLIKRIIVDCKSICGYEYGIGLNWPYDWGPDGYCYGSIHLPARGARPSDETQIQIGSWRRYYGRPNGKYKIGDLRDIYPYNMLTEPHLIRQVGSQTLKDWILSNPKHGTLEKVTDKHWLWSIDSEQIPMIQEALEPTGILLCYRPK